MKRAIDQWTMSAGFALALCASAACTKKTDAPAPEASVVAPGAAAAVASAPTVIAPLIPSATSAAGNPVPAPVLGDVKRFPDQEKAATGAVKVALDDSKVYDEPDNTKPAVATLSKDLFVVRLATLGTAWLLVDFPSGVGKLAPGWIEAKSVGAQVQATVTKAAVAAQPSAKAATTAAPSASASATAVATATATATAVPSAAVVVHKPGAILARPH